MKRLVLLLVICFSVINGQVLAQIDPEETRNHVLVKWSPLSMFDIDNKIMFGLEVPLGKHLAVQQDFGFGAAKFNIWYYYKEPLKNTYKSRTQLKFYFLQKPKWRSYIAGEYLYKKVVYQSDQWVGVGCADGTCDYSRYMRVKQGRFVSAFHSKIGWQFYFSNRTTIDVFAGLGLRFRENKIITEDVSNVNWNSNWYFWENYIPDNKEVVPSTQFGFQIGIALGKYEK